ncbi:glutathione S-transferase family protein [Acidovorax sp. ACV01]|uniref:glutathione S-transferase family protein n=1 Tax=Acidovorax sp. ACV01 TaxID=2769311 RepID=UPI00177AF651|nr:glutathione S-transferase family protein [Acidovorax sp. ACV01]MBD9391608.1 glutathione S-transferase family protein [Acidovorax sp. ACV01]
MKLYERETSGNSYKIRLLFSFLGMAYERCPIPLVNGRNQVHDDYFQLNPRGQIPTLQDEDVVVWGSTAILCYVASKYDASGRWLPRDPKNLSQVMQWLELAQNEIQSGLFLARAIQRFGYEGDLGLAQQSGKRALEVLNLRLSHVPWLAGSCPTIADISCFPYTALAAEGGIDLSAYSSVQRWLREFMALEGFIGMQGISPPSTH